MSPPPLLQPFLFFLVLFLLSPLGCLGSGNTTFSFDIHHRFSDKVRRWEESMSRDVGIHWPKEGTVEYYATLVEHDRALLRGRGLSGTGDMSRLAFSDGNNTVVLSSLGFLYYAWVEVGTPAMKFLVSLDTGSDLFWVPCNCKSCAPTSSPDYGLHNITFNIYKPSASSTSKEVYCSDTLCELQSLCSGPSQLCPYTVQYLTPNLSTTGFLVEDVMHLVREDDAHKEAVQARVKFGCATAQTGDFLDAVSPNGLFGLGMEKISVPSILASEGLVSNSFSMCFGDELGDLNGRINFGDKGTPDQDETPFVPNQLQPDYTVSVTGIRVQNASVAAEFYAIVDTGSSFTSLKDPFYTLLIKSYNATIQDQRVDLGSNFPFDYCYLLSSSEELSISTVSMIMKGGRDFPINNPIIVFATQDGKNVYCLAIVKIEDINIIGQNFLTGLRVVFDREKLVLGWKNFNCYSMDPNSLATNPRNSSARSRPRVPTTPKQIGSGGSPCLSALITHSLLLMMLLILLTPF